MLPAGNLIPERLGIFTGDRFGSGANISRSSSHGYGACEKQASPARARLLRGTKSSGMPYFSNSGGKKKKNYIRTLFKITKLRKKPHHKLMRFNNVYLLTYLTWTQSLML